MTFEQQTAHATALHKANREFIREETLPRHKAFHRAVQHKMAEDIAIYEGTLYHQSHGFNLADMAHKGEMLGDYLQIPPATVEAYARAAAANRYVRPLYADMGRAVQNRQWGRALLCLSSLQDALRLAGHDPEPDFLLVTTDTESNDFTEAATYVIGAVHAPDGEAVRSRKKGQRQLRSREMESEDSLRPSDAVLKTYGINPAEYDRQLKTILQASARHFQDRAKAGLVSYSKDRQEGSLAAASKAKYEMVWALQNAYAIDRQAKTKIMEIRDNTYAAVATDARTILSDFGNYADAFLGEKGCNHFRTLLWLSGTWALYNRARRHLSEGRADTDIVNRSRAAIAQLAGCADIVAKPRPF